MYVRNQLSGRLEPNNLECYNNSYRGIYRRMEKFDDKITGLKFIRTIKDRYYVGDFIGNGTYGQVR
jgi:hypothetical protein